MTGQSLEISAVADRFIDAIEAGDEAALRSCLSPDIIVWHNNGDIEHRLEQMVRLLMWTIDRLENMHYEDVSRLPTPDGYVQQHRLCGRIRTGGELNVHACLVVSVADDLITRIDEYMDGMAVTALFEPSTDGSSG